MATVALVAIVAAVGSGATGGAAVAVSIATAVASAAGAYIDSAFLYPAIFAPKSPPDGPRVRDLHLQTASEGDPMRFAIGPANRIAGTLIWTSGLIESSKKEGGNKHSSGQRVFKYKTDAAVGVCEGPIYNITRIWADSKLLYDNGTVDGRCKRITIYTGTNSQTPDALIQANQGAANTPAYRNTCYVVFEKLDLADYGDVMPQFHFEVVANTTPNATIPLAIRYIMRRAGIADASWDATLTDNYVTGYVTSGPQAVIKILEPILSSYGIQTQENNGVLKFIRNGYEAVIPIAPADLTSRDYADTAFLLPTRPIMLMDKSDQDIPSTVIVQHIDPSNDYQVGSQQEKMINAPFTSVAQYNYPLSFFAGSARGLAREKLFRAYIERQEAMFDLPISYFYVQENDIVTIPYAGQVYTIRVTQVDRGNNWLLKFRGTLVRVNQGVPRTGPTTLYGGPDKTTIYNAAIVRPVFFALDVPALQSAQTATPGVYFGMGIIASQAYRGTEIFGSLDKTNWQDIMAGERTGVIGTAITVLPDGPVGYWDITSTVDILLVAGDAPTSDIDFNVLQGTNRMYIGKELIAYGVVTLVSKNVYRLSRLLRGLSNSETVTATHAAGDLSVAFTVDTTEFEDLNWSDINVTRYYECVPAGGVVGDYDNIAVNYAAATLKQYSPVGFTSVTNGGGDRVMAWQRRTRDPNFPILTSPATPPLLAIAEQYRVRVYSSGDWLTGLLRDVVVTTPAFTYTAAQINADFGGLGAPAFIRVEQLNDQGTPGFPGLFTANP